jgi:hypothetical protein
MTAPVPLGLSERAFLGRQLVTEIERTQTHTNTAAAIIDIGARLACTGATALRSA